jgi:uncharacterized protein (DUF58 family)
MLQQLERDIRRYAPTGSVTLRRSPPEPTATAGEPRSYTVEITHDSLKLRRVVYLAPEELAMLLENPQIAELLGVDSAGGRDGAS